MGQNCVIILFSGGVDSTACIHYYLSRKFTVFCIFVDYGQPAKIYEEKSVEKISKFFSVPFKIIKTNHSNICSPGEIKARNAFLIFSAILENPDFSGLISLGIHAGTSYYDCSPVFIKDIQKIIDGYTNGKIVIDAPFINWNKKEILKYCCDNDISLEFTYSCEKGDEIPCGKCMSCLEREMLNANQ